MSSHRRTEHDEHNQQQDPTSQDPKSGIAGAASNAAGKTLSFMTAKLPTKTSRIAAVAAAGTLVLAGTGSAYAVHANDVSNHDKQVAAAQFAAEQKAASDKAQADAAATAAAEKAAEQKAEADAAAKAAADKAAADKAAADKAAADKAAADKAAADKAAADQRAAAAAAANRDQQRQPLPSASSSPTSTPTPTATPTQKPTTPSGGSYGSAYAIAQSIVPSGQFACFANIIERESGWNVHATNPSSGAYGLGQALPGSKMASAGSDWENNPTTQIKWTLSYMDSRYGSPCGAWSFWQSHNWY
ncbi:hypothetical protein ABH926_004602 [Catenulispora sp. GP43]|uniref:aggregation-promoting factor C-terminal-like domain-containing protein n=1 Tax=Catenulispora sp. GP43 TaxID=3156263 RepID=UPI0035195E38